ncbi:D-alanyl-D-alanine carboxypeptidase [Skermanella stibiiresistens SB22]|uniref:D-alanyl-D-alanine carboxypeptidase n=1 Tax=Skermanella stibiiresistens SB22 TaxID=1385369 RepID=W9H3M2_9PROT|nr:D-alanyl-D-alanine carboxypeptidase [Skermanella stibiiresistens SB22]
MVAAVLLILSLVVTGPAFAQSKYASIVIDAGTGEVLYRANADDPKYPASLTKMMTLYLTFEALEKKRIKLGQSLTVSRKAASQPPTKLNLKAGQRIKVEHAILGLVTKSANDAAMVLAEGIGGSEGRFATMMNQKARRLGMARTQYRNPSGLPDERQVSTARDVATLATALIRDFPKYYPYFSRASFTYRGIEYPNHNRLMASYDGMDGLKTGYIRASGFNLAASAVRQGRRLIAVVMGGDTPAWRDAHLAELLDQGFATPRTPKARAAPLMASLRAPATPNRKPDYVDASAVEVASLEEVVDSSDLATLAATVTASSDVSTDTALGLPTDKPASGPAAKSAVGPWGIQVGAFGDAAAGRRALDSVSRRLPSLLASANPQMIPVTTGGGRLFRARLMGLDEATARSVCASLTRAGEDCIMIGPQGL